ncbi:MAG TPA: putative urea ABC transporter substrate-binding protein [Solimonas sp.]|nr:putative urea ABC transporter substrate-binding protein [Solimonas sp.]
MKKLATALCLSVLGLAACGKKEPPPAPAAAPAPAAVAKAPPRPQTSFRVGWSHYTGWEPWGYMQHSGILARHAQQHGIQIELSPAADYLESVRLYAAGKLDACAMTNVDALTLAAIGGMDSTVVVIGDLSEGNDGVVIRRGTAMQEIKGRTVHLAERSVSHYLLARALGLEGMSLADVTVANASDAELAAQFGAGPETAAVSRNPLLMQLRKVRGAALVFDSSRVPGEIMDLMVARTAAPDTFKQALAGAWYETLALMRAHDPAAQEWMAQSAGATQDEFRRNLASLVMFQQPDKAAEFAASPTVASTMQQVRRFAFEQGLLGHGALSPDAVGIQFNDGTLQGARDNVKLRFTDRYMRAAIPKD